MSKLVIGVEKSRNSKTGLVAATYAPIHSCPKTCVFLNSGCYAQGGNTGIHLSQMNKVANQTKKTKPVDIARSEAARIREMSGELPLRLHIVGDCKTAKAATIISNAANVYSRKNNQKVWTYTHSWKNIPREKWGNISVLASCETLKEVEHAIKRGYAASIVRLKEFDEEFDYKGFRMVPCSELTRGIKCDKCRKCLDDKALLRENKVICFFPHGNRSYMAKGAVKRKWFTEEENKYVKGKNK